MTPKTNPRQIKPSNRTTFADHIGEIRRRIATVVGVFLLTSALAYNFHEQLTAFMMQPLGGQKLIYLTPGGGFNFIFQVTMYAGLLVVAPLIMYHIYGFIRPALPIRAQRSAVAVILAAFLLMLAGVGYGYVVAVPSALQFLSTFAGDAVTPSLTADSYLGFFLTYIAGLGILFELPLLLLFAHWARPMTPKGLMKTERFVILGAFVVAALITPTPDVFNQLMIAVPLIVIYQLGVIVVFMAIWHQKKQSNQSVGRRQSSAVRQTHVPRQHEVGHIAKMPATPVVSPKTVLSSKNNSLPRSRPPISQPRVITARRAVDGFGVRSDRPPQRVSTPPVRRSARRLSIDGISSPS